MREFLKPWRRKIGVCTLMLACVFAVGWVRNDSSRFDLFALNGKTLRMMLASLDGRIEFFRSERKLPIRANLFEMELGKSHKGYFGMRYVNNGVMSYGLDPKYHDIKWKWESIGIYAAKGLTRNLAGGPNREFVEAVVIPYWFLVIPLTALSAYLLLSKPRQPKQKKIPEPTANEGV